MAQQARSRVLAAQYNFLVYDYSSAGTLPSKWRQFSGGEISFEIAENREGGSVFSQKMATIATVGDISMSRGVVPADSSVYEWLLDQVDVLSHLPEGAGVPDPGNLRDIAVEGMHRDRSAHIRIIYHGCSIRTFGPYDFDNNSGDLLMESLTLAPEWPEIEYLG